MSCCFRVGNAGRGEVVQDGGTDLEFSHLTVEVPRHRALARQFRFADLRFTQCIPVSTRASAVAAAQSSPVRTAGVARRPQGLVARDCTCGGGFPQLGVPVLQNDGDSTRFGDGVVALSGVTGPVGSDADDLLIRRGPVGQSGQLPGGRRSPDHLRVKPDRQTAPALGRPVIGGPVQGLAGRRVRFSHALPLPHRIHQTDPLTPFVQQGPEDRQVEFVEFGDSAVKREIGSGLLKFPDQIGCAGEEHAVAVLEECQPDGGAEMALADRRCGPNSRILAPFPTQLPPAVMEWMCALNNMETAMKSKVSSILP